jgi:hypothetical protein
MAAQPARAAEFAPLALRKSADAYVGRQHAHGAVVSKVSLKRMGCERRKARVMPAGVLSGVMLGGARPVSRPTTA